MPKMLLAAVAVVVAVAFAVAAAAGCSSLLARWESVLAAALGPDLVHHI